MQARAGRSGNETAALFIDLDGFKQVNDTLGHEAGDQLLKSVAARLLATLREGDTIARLGGDEFVVLVEGSTPTGSPELVAERLLEVLREPFEIDDVARPTVRITASIGIARGNRISAADLLRDADIALYEAKAAGRDRYVTFQREMQTAVEDRLTLELDLRGALERDEYYLVYQPIFELEIGHRARRRGAAALEAPGARHRAARRVHPAARGDEAHRRRRPLGDRRGVPAGAGMAARRARHVRVGERLRPPARRRPPRPRPPPRTRRDRAAAVGARHRAHRDRDHARRRRDRPPAAARSRSSASASRSTTSGPATRRSRTCASSPSTS